MNIFLTSLILGLAANFHCVGMCGPIAMAIPVNRKSSGTILFGVLQYNFGRILSYTFLGILVGIVGVSIELFGVLQWLSILSGIFMIIFAWRKFFSFNLALKFPSFNSSSIISKAMGKTLSSKSSFKLPLLGSINGFLPCGMVYLALLNAILAGNIYSSGLSMALFGLGTLPSMVIVGFAANRINNNTRLKMNKLVPYLLTIVGVLVVLRGMNLNIPYISPKISTMEAKNEKSTQKVSPSVKMDCCHKAEKCEK